jgi:hypothetical protein
MIAGWGLPACYLDDAVTFAVALYGVARLPAMPPLGVVQRELERQKGVANAVDRERLLELDGPILAHCRHVVGAKQVDRLGRQLEVAVRLPFQLLATKVEELVERAVREQVPSLPVLDEDRRRAVVDDLLQLPPTLRQECLGPPAVRILAFELGKEVSGRESDGRLRRGGR